MGQAASKQEEFWEACGFGRPHIVKQFIKQGIDVNWKSYTHDCCPIHVASQGKPEIVSLLLEANCDVNVRDIRDNTALHHAAMKGHADIMRTLIKAGTEVNAQDKNGWSALHNACYWCYPDAVEVLLKSGADVHMRNKDNRTPLHETARSRETDERKLGKIARWLVDGGSDVNAKGSDLGEVDFTSLMFASYHGHPEVATVLLDAEAEIETCGSNWWTALHWAADREQDEIVFMLLEAGADPTKKGTRGETAADRAKNKDMKEVLVNAASVFKELQMIGCKQETKGRIVGYVPNHADSVSNSVPRPAQNKEFPSPMSSLQSSDLSNLIDRINKKSSKLKTLTRHDADENVKSQQMSERNNPRASGDSEHDAGPVGSEAAANLVAGEGSEQIKENATEDPEGTKADSVEPFVDEAVVSTCETKVDAGETKTDTVEGRPDTGDTKADTVEGGADTDDSKADTGDTKADTGDTGDTKADTVEGGADTDDSKADTDDSKADTGDTKADTGDTKADTGDTKADTGDTKADTGDIRADTGDTVTNKGDTKVDACAIKVDASETNAEKKSLSDASDAEMTVHRHVSSETTEFMHNDVTKPLESIEDKESHNNDVQTTAQDTEVLASEPGGEGDSQNISI